ncbi:MAG: hypothetical protein H7224_08820 [Polaromonas sp.]|nr:hypothetical protein [Polaromonas sp.]
MVRFFQQSDQDFEAVMNSNIDLEFRPDSYFRPQKLELYLLSQVKGTVLKRKLQSLFAEGRHAEVKTLLITDVLSVGDKKALEAYHPMFMGGNYLPDTDGGEVEIARICIESTTSDVTSVFAKPDRGRICYRVVDEYEGDTLTELTTMMSDEPLTLSQLTDFFLNAWPLVSVLEVNFEGDLDGALGFFRAESDFYPDIDRLCRRRVVQNFPAAQDEADDDTEHEEENLFAFHNADDSSPLGVPINDLLLMLTPTSIRATRLGNALIARHEHYTIRIEVVPPESRESVNGAIRAVVRMVTELPKPLVDLFQGKEAELSAAFNAFAALGALYSDKGIVRIGSRLTIYEEEDAWRTLHLPLLMYTAICSVEAILGGIKRTFTKTAPRSGASIWTAGHFEQVNQYLSDICFCTTSNLEFNCEFGLSEGTLSAAVWNQKTALFQMMADQPHPELGGGLFCILQMPHQMDDQKRLQRVCMQLNNMEMAAHDLPPHFGAWCPGNLGNNPAYIGFYPNSMCAVEGVAVNSAFWAMRRAEWANAILPALGVRS